MPPRFSLFRSLLLCVAFAAGLRAEASLDAVRSAQRLLGPATWSRVLRLENASFSSPYPARTHALVFELAGLLWFYSPSDGTQSFSLHIGNLEAEKADFGPLVRAIDPGFVRWEEVHAPAAERLKDRPLPNGCFINSVIALREQLGRGERVQNPRLLSYYIETSQGWKGHTVLAFESGGRTSVIDAARPRKKIQVTADTGADPLVLARIVDGDRVVRAREVKLDASAQAIAAQPAAAAAAGSRT